MKRKTRVEFNGNANPHLDNSADSRSKEPPAHRQRQPQTSCDFCRLKKLKCDRAQPCSSCVTRGRPCDGPPVPITANHGQPAPSDTPPAASTSVSNTGLLSVPGGNEQNILNRLQSLEEAVFGFSGGQGGLGIEPANKSIDDSRSTSVARLPESENAQPDYATACDSVAVVADYHNITFRFAQSSRLNGTGSDNLTDELPNQTQLHNTIKCIWLPSKEGTLALLDDYIQRYNVFLGIIDPQATREVVEEVYAQLSQHQGKRIQVAQVALILSIAATSAFFWDKDDDGPSYRFSSKFDAANWAVFWRNSTWDLLDQLRRDVSGSLEEIQATCLLASLISQIEGCPSRYRRLQGNALTIAREMSLHVVDAPNSPTTWARHQGEEGDKDWHKTHESEAVNEIKRRVWWHLAGTDWLLAVMGGPLYKSYTVNPLHMKVRYPRNINDSSLHNLTPWPHDAGNEWPDTRTEPPTSSTYFVLRVRVAEICHKIVDALQPIACSRHGSGGDGIEQLPYGEIVRIAKLFEDVLDSFPPSCKMHTPIPAVAPATIDLHGRIVLLYFHARRARVFRPFIRCSITTTASRGEGLTEYPTHGSQRRDLRYEEFASLCRDSARTVLTIASSLMSEPVENIIGPSPMAETRSRQKRPRLFKMVRRSGLISMHLFMACIILATDPTLSSVNPNGVSDAKILRTELAQACYILKQAAETSTMASGLLKSLTVVLNRHKLRMFCNKGHPDFEQQQPEINAGTNPGVESQVHAARQHPPPQFLGNTMTSRSNIPTQQHHDIPLHPNTGNLIASNLDGDDVVNDIWAIDQIQARVQSQHGHAQRLHTQSQPPMSTQPQDQRIINKIYQTQFPSPAESDPLHPLPLDGLWQDLVHAAAGTHVGSTGTEAMTSGGPGLSYSDDGIQWDQLFADLDYVVGPS